MAGAKSTSGGRGLNFTARLNVAEAIKAAQLFKKEMAGIAGVSGAFDTKPISNYQQAMLKSQEVLRDARLETEKLKQEQQAARVELEKSRIAHQEAATATQHLKNAEQQLSVQLQQGRISQQQYNAQLAQGRIEQQQQNSTLNQSRIDAQAARTQLAQLTLQQRQLAQQTRDARAAQRAASGSYQEAQERLKQLGQQIRSVSGGFAASGPIQQARIREYRQLNGQLTEFDRRLGNNQRNVGNYQSALKGVGAGLVQMASMYVSAYAAIGAISKIISNNAEISDSLADVRRTAGLTEKEADGLLETFKKFDTRTSLKGLLDIAIIAGQLGIAKGDIEGFTRSIDQLAVVLSGEIPGGAEAVATALGKINGVFDVQRQEGTTVEESFNKTGSAILGLGQSGLATGEFLQDFTQRLSGTAKQAGISLPTILAYGSVLEEAGKSAEVAGTALNKVIASLSVNRGSFFAIAKLADANLTLDKFTKTINTDVNDALQLFFKGLNSGNPSQTEFADRLATIPRLAGETRSSVIALAQGQDKLSEKIKLSNEDYNDANKIADQVALKSDNLAGSIDKLGKVFENETTSGRMGRFFKGFIDYLRISLSEVAKLVNSESWKEFFSRLSNNSGKSFETIKSFNEVQKKTNDNQQFLYPAGGDPTKLEEKLKKLGEVKFNNYLAALKKTADEASAVTKKYEDGVKDGSLIEKGTTVKQYKENLTKAKTYYADVLALQKKFGYDYKKSGQNGTGTEADEKDNIRTTEVIKSEIKALQDADKKLAVTSDDFKTNIAKIKVLRKELKLALGGKDTEGISAANQYQTALKSQRALQKQIDDATKKGTNKVLSADEQELESAKKKYQDLSDLAYKYNEDQAKLDAKRVKDGLKPLKLRVDGGKLNDAYAAEETSIRDKQASVILKDNLEKQKNLYVDFEDYKTKLGEDKAKKRFEGQINTERSYLENLQDQLAAFTDPQKSKGGSEVDTAGNEQQIKVLKEKIAAEKLLEDERYKDLLVQTSDYEQQRAAMVEKYNKQRAEFVAKGDTANVAELDRLHKIALGSLDDQNAAQLASFKALFEGIDKLSDKSAKGVLVQAKEALNALVKTGKISKEFAKEINDKLFETGQTLKSRLPERLNKLGSELNTLGGQVGEIDEGFGKWISTLGSVITGVGQIRITLNDIKNLKPGDLLGAASSGVGLLSAFTGIAKSVQTLFEKSSVKQEAQRSYEAEQTQKRSDAVSKQLEKQLQLINDVYGNQKIEQYRESLKDINGELVTQQANLTKLMRLTGDKVNDENIAKLNAGGTGYIKGLTLDQINALKLPVNDLKELQKLLDNGLLDSATANLVKNFLDLKQAAIDAENAIKSVATGSSFTELADSIVDLFAQGNASAADFGANFEAIIKKSLVNSFKTKVLADQLQKFYDQFATASESNGSLDASEIEKLRSTYNEIIKNGTDKFEELKKLGIDFDTAADGAAGVTGAITSAGLTEDTGNKAMGIWRGQYDIAKQTGKTIGDIYQIAIKHFNSSIEISANTLRTANNTDGISKQLDQVIANTKPAATSGGDIFRNAGIK